MPRPVTSILLYLGLVFLSGVLVGGFGYRLMNPPDTRAGDPRTRYEEEMKARLKLRPEQLPKFRAILDSTGERFRLLREKFRPEFEAVQKDQVEAINQILDEPQKKEYEKLRKERELQRQRDQQRQRRPASSGR